MRKPNPFVLSDGLKTLYGRFEARSGGSVEMSADGVSWLIGELRQLHAAARNLENEVSALKWNRLGLPDTPDAVIEAACRPGSNVALFPVRERPFSDGSVA